MSGHLWNDGLLAFVENFVKDHFLPTMFVDYRKGVQQAISSKFFYMLQNLVLGWAQAMPKFAGDLVKYSPCSIHQLNLLVISQAVLEKQSYMLIGRHDIEKLMRFDPSSAHLPNSVGESNMVNSASDAESLEIESELNELLFNLRPIKQENLIHDDNKLILLASLSDSLEYVADSIERQVHLVRAINVKYQALTYVRFCLIYRLGKITSRSPNQVADNGKTLASFADDYRKLAIDCLKVLRVEMQLETIFHMQITRRDEEMAPFVAGVKQNYIFGGICSIATSASIKALADMKSINLFGVQQICRNSIALEQALAAIPSIDSEAVQQRLDHVRTYYELLNMPYEANRCHLLNFQALLAFITEHEGLFTAAEYINLLKVNVSGRETPPDAQDRVLYILSH
ncbi:hypothetical protein POTOM_060913 [Populus tomentosa]|uniref:Exocyst complex component Sec8 n=1 Tax=Populus tomentosa TaxID=118781 RepID=A0A8X8C0N2_POPTO|nr:hypothetical protein POTOM_060913 [Populus tomentosa]